jgi:deazaflavin-dependent oxidoreductase (nitroreductase family)
MPNIRWLIPAITHVHRMVYRVSRGRIGGRALGLRFLLLRHVGRRSQLERLIPLLYLTEGDDRWIVAASNGGNARDPAWWLNLKSHPHVRIDVGTEWFDVDAREATPEECARLWPRLIATYRSFADYRERAGRRIPIVIFERAAEPKTDRDR